MNLRTVNEIYSGIKELISCPTVANDNATNEDFLRPILSESAPKKYDENSIELIYMLLVNAS